MEDKIDILLATYNSNIIFLKKQIDSILNQTYKNFNLIISDDKSTNGEVIDLLNEYKNKDKRITLYIQEKNLGYTKNFEFLLSKSNANYIAFSDHDDIWYINKLERSLKVLKEKNVDLVYSDCNQIDENDNIIHQSYLIYKNMPNLNNYKKDRATKISFSRHIAIGCSQMFTKDVKNKMIPFNQNTMAHDWNSVYIASRLKGVYEIEEPLFAYRLHGNNAFGGRNFKQNMKLWKKENKNNYQGFLKYRHKVITDTYLAGAKMCLGYNVLFDNNENINNFQNEIITYYKECQNVKIINFKFNKYFKYLYFHGVGKKGLKEFIILHFPIISYFVYIVA